MTGFSVVVHVVFPEGLVGLCHIPLAGRLHVKRAAH